MLQIDKYDTTKKYRVLEIDTNLFHNALNYVLKGEERFHVNNKIGANFDLVYVNNNDWAVSSEQYTDALLFRENILYPPYYVYDENDREKLCFDIFNDYNEIWFETANEYSIVLAKIILNYTKKKVKFADERCLWFLEKTSRIRIGAQSDASNELKVFKNFVPSAFNGDFSKMDAMVLFHHVFFFQWLTPLKMKDIKYAEFTIPKTEGMGSILLALGRANCFFMQLGIQVSIKRGCTRYNEKFLNKYFNLPFTPRDSNKDNTIYIVNYYSAMLTKMLMFNGVLDISIMSSGLRHDMEEYAQITMENKKILGVLLRGSDYITTQMGGGCRAVPVEFAKEKIREWFSEGKYDKIFLATEDKDILNEMREEFPGKVIAIAQERYQVSDFVDGMTTISEIDKNRHPGETYDNYIEDVTVNYFYAIYLLSLCEEFMYSCYCSGAVIVKMFNNGKFKKEYCFAEHIEESEC